MKLINLLRHISLKHVRHQKAQLLMAISGICLGVAAMVAIDLVNKSVLLSFEESINHVTGRAALQITGAEAGFPEQMLERVQEVEGVEYAVPVIEAIANFSGGKERSLMILGIDVLQDYHLRDYSITDESADIPDPLLFLAKRDSILLTRAMAVQEGLAIDQQIEVQTVAGIRTFQVRGLLNPDGPARVAGGDIAVMDIYAAQMAFGMEGRIHRIDVSFLPGADLNTMKKRIQAALPEGYTIDTPAGRTRQVEILLNRFRKSMGLISFLALFIGMYLIYNAVTIAVVQRHREIGILRALGAGRAQIAGLFLAETLVLAAIASSLGVGLGLVFAKASIGAVAAILCSIALFVSSANAVNSVRRSVFDWVDSIIRADILVSSGHPLATGGLPTIAMPASMQEEMEKIPGVRLVDPYRKAYLNFKGRKILLEIFDVTRRMEYCPAMIVEGSREDMTRLLPDQDNVVINEGFAARHRLKPGDVLELATPSGGMVRFGISAVVVSYSSDSGVIWMDINTYRRHWQDSLVDTYEVLVQPGEDIATARQAILDRFGGDRRLFALPAAEFRAEVQGIIDRSFAMTNAVNTITLIIAGLGIVVTLLASVLERTREIGILRSIGMLRGQISGMILVESTLIGSIGGALGITAGILIGWMELEGAFRLDFGASIGYHPHYGAMAWALLLAAGLAALAGLYPARQAAKTNIVEALTYE